MLKKLLPEKIPAFGAVLYSLVPARMFLPHYKMIAAEVNLAPYGRILDIGTGPGRLPIEIAIKFPCAKVIGIDLSEKMIKIANRNKAAAALANLEFKVMDAKALEFADNSLDMVISTGSLHHWKDPLRIINEAYRCLKPQGEAWIYDGYAEAADGDIQRSIHKFLGFFPSNGIIRQILSIHGYSQAGYDTMVKDIVAESRFKACFFEKRGVMMRLRMKK